MVQRRDREHRVLAGFESQAPRLAALATQMPLWLALLVVALQDPARVLPGRAGEVAIQG